jgi:hypothetical protein
LQRLFKSLITLGKSTVRNEKRACGKPSSGLKFPTRREDHSGLSNDQLSTGKG